MRTKILIGAWKAYLNNDRAVELALGLRAGTEGDPLPFEMVVCPSFVSLVSVGKVLDGSRIRLGAQNVHWEGNGARTGQVTPEMLVGVGCRTVILGHSELRAYGESDENVNKRVHASLQSKLHPVVCVGESREERTAGTAESRIESRVRAALRGVEESLLDRVAIAYEPLWAIRSDKNPSAEPATVEEACEMHSFIRATLSDNFGAEAAASIRILYGGSVSALDEAHAGHTEALVSNDDVEGLLVGSASIEAPSFLAIAQVMQQVLQPTRTLPRTS